MTPILDEKTESQKIEGGLTQSHPVSRAEIRYPGPSPSKPLSTVQDSLEVAWVQCQGVNQCPTSTVALCVFLVIVGSG